MLSSLSVLLETALVGTLAYIAVIVVLRCSGKRTLSKWNSFDFVVTIAFGSVLANVMLSNSTSLIQGITGFSLLVLLQFVITWIASRSSFIQQLIKAKPALLVYKGQFLHKVMKQERVARGEVLAAIRAQGLASLENVGAVVLETDGSFSVIKELHQSDTPTLQDVEGYTQITSSFS